MRRCNVADREEKQTIYIKWKRINDDRESYLLRVGVLEKVASG